MRTGNIGGTQGGRRPETGECPMRTVVHRSSGGDQKENEYRVHCPLVATGRQPDGSRGQ